jgi:type IV secretory pathway TraG/TraD family ATPase VirD4
MGANATICKDMLVNMTDWSEEHYKTNTERYVQRLTTLLELSGGTLSFKQIIHYLPTENFMALSAGLLKENKITKAQHIGNKEIAETSGKIAENASARFSTVAESEIGAIFDENGVDIYTALKEKAIILFILNPLIYPELSPLLGRLILIDSKKAVSRLFGQNTRTFFIFDEINVYASSVLIDLINKSRSANVTTICATQSLADLETVAGDPFKQQIIENCNNYIVLRQNSAKSAEEWAEVIGTRQTMEVTYQLRQNNGAQNSPYNGDMTTGYGSAKRVREFLYHPDDIKSFKTGQGVYLSRDNGAHCKLSVHKPF